MIRHTAFLQMFSVMLAFFVMGVCDLVGIGANYAKTDFDLSDTLTNLLPFMVFLWFFVLSVPTGIMMNRIGRRATVLVSLYITLVALLIPFIHYSFVFMLLSFSLIGIGNTLLQVSLNPLLAHIVTPERLSGQLTLGQSIKAIASFATPVFTTWAATQLGDWRLVFLAFTCLTLVSILCLHWIHIDEGQPERRTSFSECFALLSDPFIFLLFVGLLVHVGTDVGVNTTAPKLLTERTGIPLSATGYAASAYFLFRIIGCFVGVFLFSRFSARYVFLGSILTTVVGTVGLFFCHNVLPIYACIAFIGLGNANLFSVIYSQALRQCPERSNAISGLMIMAVSGGALFPLLMGIGADLVHGQTGALVVLALCVSYLLFILAPKIR